MTNFLNVQTKYKKVKASNLIAIFVILFVFAFIDIIIKETTKFCSGFSFA